MTTSAVQKVLVVGGNGFIGSAVCRAALAKGLQVTSVSSSGRPYRTPKGHTPEWTSKVTWLKGDATDPSTFSHVLPEMDGVVHSLGTLLEDTGYKQAIKKGDVLGLASSLFSRGGSNPLKRGSYETLNRDSAMRVCEAFIASGKNRNLSYSRPFVFLSAEDCNRPLIPRGYVESKRQAEKRIDELTSETAGKYRGVYIRPTLVYHSHYRPFTTLPATILDLSASLHSKIPPNLPVPTPSKILHALASVTGSQSPQQWYDVQPTVWDSIDKALTVPPIHVDQVGSAVVNALTSEEQGVIDVWKMRKMLGWSTTGSAAQSTRKDAHS